MLQALTLLDRGFTGHEHLQTIFDFLTKNGDGILPYSFVYSSCSTHTGLALNLAGIPTLFIHPYTVQGSVWLWNKGITPSNINNSYHLQNQRK